MPVSAPGRLSRRRLCAWGATAFTGAALSALPAFARQDDDDDMTAAERAAARRDALRQAAETRRQGADGMRAEYRAYADALRQSFADYRNQLRERWGAREGRLPGKTTLVEYGSDLSSRRRVDFANGRAGGSVLIGADEDPRSDAVRQRLAGEIAGLLRDGADSRPMADIAQSPDAAEREGPAVLDGQVDLGGRSPDAFAAAVAARRLRVQPVEGADGVKRQVVSVDFDLAPDHVARRAARYENLVNDNAKRFSVQTPLIWAIMETESAFQPRAKSPIPAFGLMQLVPTSGALDAYEFVYGEPRLVTDTYLYDPAQNVELGTAYLRLVYDRYLRWVENDRTRLWATVASYNTGSGNVRKAFGRDVSSASRAINAMSPEEAFAHMRRRLPYQETRDYIVKVRDKSETYGGI